MCARGRLPYFQVYGQTMFPPYMTCTPICRGRRCGCAQRSMPQWGIEPHERAGFAGWRPSLWPPSADAPQVCVVDRFGFIDHLCQFVGRGLDPSTCDNPNPSGASGTPPPTSKFQMANGIGGVKTPPYSTIGKGDVGGDACIAPQRPPKRADDEHRPLQYGCRGF